VLTVRDRFSGVLLTAMLLEQPLNIVQGQINGGRSRTGLREGGLSVARAAAVTA
jgi:hypothetical protein